MRTSARIEDRFALCEDTVHPALDETLRVRMREHPEPLLNNGVHDGMGHDFRRDACRDRCP